MKQETYQTVKRYQETIEWLKRKNETLRQGLIVLQNSDKTEDDIRRFVKDLLGGIITTDALADVVNGLIKENSKAIERVRREFEQL